MMMGIYQRLHKQSIFFTSLLSILLALLVGAVLLKVAGYSPLTAYRALFVSALLQPFDLGETIRTITPLILTGAAVAIAFRTGLFNIGVEGQWIMGQLAATVVALHFRLPPFLHVVIAMLAGGLAGALWGAVPGILKATRGVHEVIISIMMNFIALGISNVLVRTWLARGSDSTDKIPATASLRIDSLSALFDGARIHAGILIALLAVWFMYFLLWRMRLGYELRAVGYNPLAAEYAGMQVKRNLILALMISGSFAGLAGAGEVLGTLEYLSVQPGFTGIGFDGIAVALLGANTPLGVILSACLFGILTYGGENMQFETDIPFEIIRILFAAIILFVAIRISDTLSHLFKKTQREGVKRNG
jgi:general nucleoside transport system permease protein